MQYLLIEIVVEAVMGALRLSWRLLRVMWYFAGFSAGVSVRLLVENLRLLRAAAVWQAPTVTSDGQRERL